MVSFPKLRMGVIWGLSLRRSIQIKPLSTSHSVVNIPAFKKFEFHWIKRLFLKYASSMAYLFNRAKVCKV